MTVSLVGKRSLAQGVMVALVGVGLAWSPASVSASVPAPAATPGASKSDSLAPHVAGEIIVGFEASAGSQRREEVRRAVGARSSVPLSGLANDAEVLTLGSNMGVARAIEALKNAPGVRFVEPNYILTTTETSNDPDYLSGNLWGMLGATTSPSNAFGSRAGEAWANGYIGSSDVVIGVIDEGIDVTHPDLVNNIWISPGEIAGNGIDDDSNGFIDDVYGFDFVNNDGSVLDSNADSHGTHVAGTIGAEGGNGVGVAGVNWNVSMISAKFLQGGSGSSANAVRAVDYITGLKQKYGLNIVATSNSWGGGGFSQALLDAIERGGDAGILFIAAAGNSAVNNDAGGYYPSGYQCTKGGTRGFDCVISVASITNTGALSSFSSFGPTTVDIAAPGSGVKSTTPGNSYAVFNGTSMATPHVSGAAALCRAANPSMTAGQIRTALVESERTTDSLAGKTVNSGRLDLTALLKRCVPPTSPMSGAPSSLTGISLGLTSVRLDWTDGATNETGYVVQRAAGPTCVTYATIGQVGADNSRYFVSGLQADTSYCFRVGSTNGSTTQWSSGIVVATDPPPTPYVCSSTGYAWVETPAGAATHALSDDSAVTVSIPFGFDLYGVAASSVQISSNGYLRFGAGPATAYTNAPIPSASDPNSMAAAWWMDFNPARGGTVRSHVAGSAPNRTLVISWLDVLPFSTAATNGATFQIVLDEATRSLTYQYLDTVVGSTSFDRGRTGTVGVEGTDGSFGTQVVFNAASLTDASAVRCTRSLGPIITTTSLAAGVRTEAYSQTIGVTGGTGTRTLSLVSGSLPPGLSLSGFDITGTPTSSGTWSFTLQVLDQNGLSSTSALQIAVGEPVGVATSSLGAATIGSAYSQSLTASGGTGPYAWSLASGSLPAGLSLSGSGAITGTPTSSAKNATFVARVTDANNKVATAELQIRVTVAITTSTVSGATRGTPYTQSLTSVGGAAGVNHTWQVFSGSLPDGLLMSSAGVISGTPSASATTSTFEAEATDGTVAGTARRSFTLTVVAPLQVSTSSLADGKVGIGYSQTLSATGASGSVTWAIVIGTLPAGLTLNSSTGVISGTPTSSGVSDFTVRATDSTAKTADKALSITVAPATAPAAFNKTSPSNGATRVSRSAALLSWGSSARATRYEYCVDRINNNVCDGSWISVSGSLSTTLSGLLSKTTYFWQIRAVNASSGGETTYANNNTWWSFRTQ